MTSEEVMDNLRAIERRLDAVWPRTDDKAWSGHRCWLTVGHPQPYEVRIHLPKQFDITGCGHTPEQALSHALDGFHNVFHRIDWDAIRADDAAIARLCEAINAARDAVAAERGTMGV